METRPTQSSALHDLLREAGNGLAETAGIIALDTAPEELAIAFISLGSRGLVAH
jgi:hypothetical protein